MHNYSIHDIIRIKASEEIPIPSYFKTRRRLAKPDIEILRKNLIFSRPKDNEILRKDHYFWKKKSTLFIDYDFLNVKLLIDDLLGKVKIMYTGSFRRLSTDIGWKRLVMAVVWFKLIQKGYAFAHAGCLSYRGNQAILVAGLPDTGKTSTILSLLDGEQFRFMSDDQTIIGKDGLAYSYPLTLKVSPRALTGRVTQPRGKLMRKLLKSHAFSFAFERFLRRETAKPARIPDEWIEDKNPIKKVFLIRGYGKKKIEKISRSEAVKAISTVSAEIFQSPLLFQKYLDLYCYSFDIDFFDLSRKRREIFEKAIKNAKCYNLVAPNIEKYPLMVRRTLENERR